MEVSILHVDTSQVEQTVISKEGSLMNYVPAMQTVFHGMVCDTMQAVGPLNEVDVVQLFGKLAQVARQIPAHWGLKIKLR